MIRRLRSVRLKIHETAFTREWVQEPLGFDRSGVAEGA